MEIVTQIYGPFISLSQAKGLGLKLYYDGQTTCRNGHCDVRRIDGAGTKCVECSKAKCRRRHHAKSQDGEWREAQNARTAAAKRRCRAALTPEQREQNNAKRRAAKTPEQREHERLYALRRYRETPREERRAAERRYVEANRDKYNARVNAYQKAKRETDLAFRVSSNYRSFIANHIAKRRGRKSAKLEALVGCTPAELVAHLERQFTDGMSWDNYGEWHIDHIRPCASFEQLGTSEAEQRECFHYTNLQPLWALENIKKGAAWAPREQQRCVIYAVVPPKGEFTNSRTMSKLRMSV